MSYTVVGVFDGDIDKTVFDECDLLLPILLIKPLVLSPPLLVLFSFEMELFFKLILSWDSWNVGSKRSFEPICGSFLRVTFVDFGVTAVAVDEDDAVDNPILFKLDVEVARRWLFGFDCFADPDGPLRNNDFNLIIAHLSCISLHLIYVLLSDTF